VDVINELILQTVASPWLYAVLLAVTVIDGFFPPVPSETVLVAAAAVLTSTGDLWALIPLGLIAALGAAIGDNIAFGLGRRLGTTRWAWMRRPRVASAFAHAERALEQRSAALILGARYIPVGRVAVNMSAGALGFPWRRFLPLSVVAGTSWSALSLTIGLLAGSWVKEQPLVSAGIGIVVALVIGLIVDRVTAARRRRAPVAQLAG
jgi:membrane protein DedA with SNARE-associated domain